MKRFQLKSRLSMAFQPSADSFSIRRLGFKCSWWHRRQTDDAVASERSIFSENHDYKRFFPCCDEHVRTYISGSRCAWWQKTTNRHTHGTTTITLATPRVIYGHAITQYSYRRTYKYVCYMYNHVFSTLASRQFSQHNNHT